MKIGIITAPTLKDVFVERIVEMILSGRFAVGDKLPTERDLAEETRISKTVVHAGMEELSKLGFVEIIPRKGVFVANYALTGTMETLNAILRHNGGSVTRRQAESLFKTRVVVEGAAMRELAAESTEEKLGRLEEIIAKAETQAAHPEKVSTEELADTLYTFHLTVCAMSDNIMLPLMMNSLKPFSLAFWENSVRAYGAWKCIRLLKRYVEFFRRGDGEGAVAALVRSQEDYWFTVNEPGPLQ